MVKNNFRSLLEASEQKPQDDSACIALAMARFEREEVDDALDLLERAIKRGTTNPDAFRLKAAIHENAERYPEAFSAFLEAAKREGDGPQLDCHLARLCMKQGDDDSAVLLLLRAIEKAPETQLYYDDIAGCIVNATDYVDSYAKVTAALPPNARETSMLTAVSMQLVARGLHEQAIEAIQRLAAINPEHPRIAHMLALIDARRGDYVSAKKHHAAILTNETHDEWALIDYIKFLISIEDLESARCVFFKWHNLRRASEGVIEGLPPLWDGEVHPGSIILLAEPMGHGDTLMNTRFAAWIAKRGMRVFLETRPAILSLCQAAPGVDQAVLRCDDYEDASHRIELYSLPMFVDDDLSAFGRYVPYFSARHNGRLDFLIPGINEAFTIGLSWEGSKHEPNNIYTWRSMQAELLKPLLDLTGVRCVNLQAGSARSELGNSSSGAQAITLGTNTITFEMTASVMAGLDLVVTIDSALAHLAGGLQVPTFILLPFTAEWRWLVAREDSPWYPSVRLFRQRKPGDWKEVIARMLPEIEKLVSQKQRVRHQQYQ